MDPDAPRSPVFPAGVASFDPTPDSVLLWTLAEPAGEVSWELGTDDHLSEVVASGSAESARGATCCITVDGLEPARTYWYRFTATGRTSAIGRTRTLPRSEDSRLRIGVVCCARFGQARFEVYRALAAAEVDVVVHLGDYIYEDTKVTEADRDPEPDHECVTVADYRTRHRQFRSDADLQALHARHPMVAIWDDHDIADNAHREGAASHDEETQGPWSARLAAALAAHHEFLPKRLADPEDPTTPWRSLDAGALARIIATETRAHRDPLAGEDGAAPADDPARTMLGWDQRRWLTDELADAEPRWSVLLTGTVLTELVIPAAESLDGALPEKYAVVDGDACNTDQWDGYTAERAELVAAARRRGGATLVLSGDIHSAWSLAGPSDHEGPVAVELTCPPAATTPLGRVLPPGAGRLLADTVTECLPQVRWMEPDQRGYLALDITASSAHAAYWWVGDDGVVTLGRRCEVRHGSLPPQVVELAGGPNPAAAPTARVALVARRVPVVATAAAVVALLAAAAALAARRTFSGVAARR